MTPPLMLSAIRDAIERATRDAPYLREAVARHTRLIDIFSQEGIDPALAAVREDGDGGDIMKSLRDERAGTALILALADLSGMAGMEETVARLTGFADDALDRAIRAAMRERSEAAEPVGFAAIALGKQGSRELNFSSDIDPIFIYDPETLPRRPREDAAQAAVRIARRVIDLLQTRTGDGYVLRVDLRLRPSPDVFPIALPIDAAISYYESSALAWERAAFIRARAAAGDIALGETFLAAIGSFVWRRSLDFGAIEEITGISRRIRDEHPDAQEFGPGCDLKRGRGGIREIEFFAQVHQLIHGGRDSALRAPATLDALAALADAGHVDGADATALADAYRQLRTIEHRLQMIDDRQTHSLPHGEALDAVARLHGLADREALLSMLAPHVERVRALYDDLAGKAEHAPSLPGDSAALETVLAAHRFSDAGATARQMAAWRQGQARSLRSPAAREAFEAILPAFVEAAGKVPDPDRVLNRFGDIVERLPSGINLYRLLEARPGLVDRLVQILGHAPALADQLARRSELLDGLISASALDPPPGVDDLVAEFAAGDSVDYERKLDTVRRRVNDWRFALGVQLIAAKADPLDVARGYARVAEGAVRVLADATIAEFAAIHGNVPGSELAIVGLGRLGGGALTHASDLDLVMLFTGDPKHPSDGNKPLGPNDYFNRLARRVTAALSIPTAAGPLYEVDTRLRPSGIHGMLAVSLDAFEEYQRTDAWTFEHMALTRARTVFGSPEARREVDAAIAAILSRPRSLANVVADAAAMRAEMTRHKPAAGAFDIKQGEGGLVDLEFAVQVRQLVSGTASHPALGKAIRALVDAGEFPATIVPAQQLLGRLLVTLRLVAPDGRAPDPASQDLVAAVCGFKDWTSLVAALGEARHVVAQLWRATIADRMDDTC